MEPCNWTFSIEKPEPLVANVCVTRTCHGLLATQYTCLFFHVTCAILSHTLLSLSHAPLSRTPLFSRALLSSQPRGPLASHKSMFKIHLICFLKDAFECYLTRGPDVEWQLSILAKELKFRLTTVSQPQIDVQWSSIRHVS